jgi:N6-adenosine-specific RNA methylase IME4
VTTDAAWLDDIERRRDEALPVLPTGTGTGTELDLLRMVESAKRQLAEASSLHVVRDIMDKAEALRVYLRSQQEAGEAQNVAAEVALRARRRAGELLAEMPGFGRGKKLVTMTDLGIGQSDSKRWQRIAGLPEGTFEEYIHATIEADKELTTAGALKLARQLLAQQTTTPTEADEPCSGIVGSLSDLIADGRKFRTVYADPPWRYGNQGTRASTDNHYGTMTVDDICAEPVSQVVEDDAHLHLWTTNAFLFDARRVMEAWGFEYKSCFIWVKPQMGIGNYWRVSHEFMLFGIRGTCPFLARDEMSWAQLDRTEHSSKPDAIRVKVEKVSPGPYLEMYGRVFMPDSPWTVYGNQVKRRLF